MPELEAGRELDALVAEKVLGLIHAQGQTYCDKAHGGGSDAFTSCPVCRPAKYSTKMAAAWEVAEYFIERKGWEITVCGGWPEEYGKYIATFGPGGLGSQQGASAPLTICLAALQALGVEVGHA